MRKINVCFYEAAAPDTSLVSILDEEYAMFAQIAPAIVLQKEEPDRTQAIIWQKKTFGEAARKTLRNLRTQFPQAPILLLASDCTKAQQGDLLNAGADYIGGEPHGRMALKIVAARFARYLKDYDRHEPMIGAQDTAATKSTNPVRIDVENRTLAYGGKETIDLSDTQLRLLGLLAANSGRYFQRADLLDHVWGEGDIAERTVDSTVKHIRKKLEKAGFPPLIETKYGRGYCFTLPPASPQPALA